MLDINFLIDELHEVSLKLSGTEEIISRCKNVFKHNYPEFYIKHQQFLGELNRKVLDLKREISDYRDNLKK